jgi:hypothetical protein
MAFKAGTTAKLYIGNAAGALQDLSAFADNFSWPQSVAALDVTTFGNSAMQKIPGLTDGDTITVSGPLDITLHTQLGALKAAGSVTPIVVGLMGSVATYPRSAGSLFVAQYTTSVGVGGRVEFSASLQVTGATTNGVF